MMADSVVTSSKNVALVGKYNDNYVGEITASSFIEMTLPSVSEDDVTTKAIFDSIVIHLTTNASYFGDTLVNQNIYIHKLKQTIQSVSAGSNGYLFNTSNIEVEDMPIAEKTFKSRPSQTNKSIVVRLPDEIGIDLLNKFKTKAKEVQNNENFVNYFKGLALLPDLNSVSSIMGYNLTDTNFMMRLHYHEIKSIKENKQLTFKVNTSRQFNRIIPDRSATPLNVLNKYKKEVSSSNTNNQAYVASGAVLGAKMQFPTLDNLLQIGQFGYISRAILYIRPVRGSYKAGTPLPRTLNLLILNESNEALQYITDDKNNVQTGNLVIDNVYYENTYYQFDLTSFLNGQLGVPNAYKYNLQLVIPASEEGSTVKRLVIGDGNNSRINDRIKLEIYFTSYNGRN